MTIVLLLSLLVAGSILAALMVSGGARFVRQDFPWRKFRAGAPIIYRAIATSAPGREAHQVQVASKGEFYYYVTHKYWRVEEVRPDGIIVARSSLMEQYFLRANDPNLRKASLFERLRYATRFPYSG
ncbi:MAG TPA: hypothetical protein VFJ88_02390 [Chthoniobacterales bacterium]|jgi:hypothetical protein|nr:hypothetical protein [Chthoniobacterales bacterium]